MPRPRRRALEAALLRGGDGNGDADPPAVGLATLDVLRAVAEPDRLAIAVDDTQWLDPSSAQTLAYALPRLEAENVRLSCAGSAG